jgi:FkbM family methyltransferase
VLNELRYELIRTVLEQPAIRLRDVLGYLERRRHPELRELHLEGRRISAVLRQLIRPASSCIDVGCHYGSILSQFCRLAPQGRHMAIEAMPSKVRFLRRKFPEVDVRETTVADHKGMVTFYVNRKATGYSGLGRHGTGDFEELTVPCAPLDELVPRDRRFDFLKVDVEGAELLVFRGASEFLGRDRPIILFECGPGALSCEYPPGSLHALLTETLDYAVFFLKDVLAGGLPVDRATFEAALVYPFKAFNWLGVPTERILEVMERRHRRP